MGLVFQPNMKRVRARERGLEMSTGLFALHQLADDIPKVSRVVSNVQ